ncbi:hypothetical protein X275_05660 [Marinitoga sp. 1197]|uniref:hypothetical protein n=1 Tax=Marinitoga sp. 1197 TaxID=1428449 RepID=UPI0006411B14|nr:hypothetical protein [Marinitoga sp. 1197]KLO22538.1 hypothetical protein X275_05660 [Marinitoga sp. 1197]
MKKINILIFLIIIFLLQSCIFKDQPPIIESMNPSNGEKINPGGVAFSWSAKDPEKKMLIYNFYLYSNGQLKYKAEDLASNNLKVNLEENTKYDWVLEVIDISGNRTKGEVSFETNYINSEPIKSILRYPENNNKGVNPYDLKFEWYKSIDFDGDQVFYNLYLSESTPLNTPIASALTNTEYTIKKLKLDTTYFWKIESYDSFGASEVSETWTFKTLDNTPPMIDFPKEDFIVSEGEEFNLDLKNYVSDMEDNYFEYQINTNNGAIIQGSKYIFKPDYNFVSHPASQKKIGEIIIVSDTKENVSGTLNIIVKDVNRNPEKPQIVYPKNNSIVPKNFQIEWNCIDLDNDQLKFDIYLGTRSKNYTKIATLIENNKYDVSLNDDTEYFLKIVAKDNYGGIKSSEEIEFRTKKEVNNVQWVKDITNIKDIFMYNDQLIVITNESVYRLNTNGTIDKVIDLNNIIGNSIIYQDKLYVVETNGDISIIDLNIFELKNTINIGGNVVGLTANEDYKGVKQLYIITSEGILYVYDIDNFILKWQKNYEITPSSSILIIENGYIVIFGEYGNSGKIIIAKPKGEIYKEINLIQPLSSFVINDEESYIYFAIGNFIYSYDKNGVKRWELSVSEEINGEILYDGEYFYASGNNAIFKINKYGNLVDTYSSNNIFSKTMLISKDKNIIAVNNIGLIKGNNEINIAAFEDIKTYALLNDGLLYFASEAKLYALSIDDEETFNNDWYVFGKNINKNRTSYVRNNTPPKKPELIYPQNQSVEIPTKIKLMWQCEDMEDDELTYSIYLGEGDNLELVATTQSTSYEVNLENDKKYYWKVIVGDGEFSTESDLYSFTAIPPPAEEKFKVKVEGATIYSPAISEDNIIYFSTSSGNIYSYNTYGDIIWKYNTIGFIKSSVVLNPLNQVIVGNENGELYIINSNGMLSNKIILDGSISIPVSLGKNGEIFVITDIGNIYKLSFFGEQIWKKELRGNPTTNIVVDKDNNIYFGMDNHLYSLDDLGNIRFEKSFNNIISTDLSIDEYGNVYFAIGNKVYSINEFGDVEFEKDIGEKVIGTIFIDNDNAIIFETLEGNLYRYYYLGKSLEKIQLNEKPYTLILMDGIKYITTKDKFIVYNGELRWYDEYRKVRYSPNIDNNGVIIFGTTEGFLYGIYGDTNKLRNSAWPIYLGDKRHTGNINGENIIVPTNRPPLKPYNPYPADNSDISVSTITLTWESSDPDGDNVYYNLYLGDNINQQKVASDISQNSYKITNLIPGTYYWYVEAYDNYGNISKSELWSFTVTESAAENNPPLKPVLLEPVNNANNVSNNAVLKWQCSDPDGDSLTYDIYINSEPMLSIPVKTNYNGTIYSIVLDENKTYYWKIVAKDGKGGETSSDIYSFTTSEKVNNPPNKPILIEPLNNSTNIEPDVTLSWSATDPDGDSLTYDLYLSKTPDLTSPYRTGLTLTSLFVSNLELGTTYYWKVVAKDGKGGENSSDVYKFTVTEAIDPLTPKLYFKDTVIPSGDQGDVIIHGQKIENVIAFDIEVSYDKTKLSVSENSVQFIGELSGRSPIVSIKNGTLKITLLSFSSFNINNSDIIKITFTSIGQSGSTKLRFTNNTQILNRDGKKLNIDISDIGIITIQ